VTRQKESATEAHYDLVPFDVVGESQEELEAFQIPPLKNFLQGVGRDDLSLDVGCGVGRHTIYMHRVGRRVVGLELSRESLKSIKKGHSVPLVQASNLGLPFRSDSFDSIISDGVISYTDDPRHALAETLRVLKEDGRLFVALYKRNHYYYYLHTYVGGALRFVLRRVPLGSHILDVSLLPVYHGLRNLIRRGRGSDWQRSRALFYDYFLAPNIRFYRKDEVLELVEEMDSTCMSYDVCPGWNAHTFLIRRKEARAYTGTPRADSVAIPGE
jgi:SAM-dependent methyltransferase